MLQDIRSYIEQNLEEEGFNIDRGNTPPQSPWAALEIPSLKIEKIHGGMPDFSKITAYYILKLGVENLQSNSDEEEKLEEYTSNLSSIIHELNDVEGILRADVKSGRLAEIDEATNTFIYEFEIEVQFTRR